MVICYEQIMKATIRFGLETDIFKTLAGHDRGYQRERLEHDAVDAVDAEQRSLVRTILLFSGPVSGIPDMPTFDRVIRGTGVQTRQLPNPEVSDTKVEPSGVQDKVVDEYAHQPLTTTRTVEVVNSNDIGAKRLKLLAAGLFRLADESGLGDKTILFINHTIESQGCVIAFH